MKHIFKNMGKYWYLVVVIFIFLCFQAVFDFSLPDYTSKLINTGIIRNGVEYATPDKISAKSFKAIEMVMTDSEAELWEASYSLDEDGNYSLKSGLSKEELDESFVMPIAVYGMLKQMAESDSFDMMQNMPQMSTDNMLSMRKAFEEKLAELGEDMVQVMAINFTMNEYEDISVNTNDIRNQFLLKTGGIMLLFTLGMVVCAVVVGFLASKVGAGVGRDLRNKIYEKVVRFSDAEINKFSTASLITRTTNDVQQIQQVTTMLLRMVMYAPIMAVAGIFMVLKTKAGMGFVIVIAVFSIMIFVVTLTIIAMPKFKIMQKLIDKVNLVSREILTGLPVIRAFSREHFEEKRFDEANKELTSVMLFINRVMTFMMPTLIIIMNMISVLIVWIAAHRIDSGTMEIGTMTAFITYTMMIIMSFLMLTMISIMLPRAGVAADRINEVLTTDISVNDCDDPKELKDIAGVVKFDDVSFGYPDSKEDTLSHISFTARPGTTTAIIGSTGCGKSTLVNLIPRFFDVTGGKITIDGMDIRDASMKSLRRNIGYVPQKGMLFSGTIETNIKYGQEKESDKLMYEAARIAQAEEFINEKPEKYNSPIAQGGNNVSGGQKQRLSIARAIAKNPKIFIFDDSFSALDFKTDVALRKELEPKVKDSTVFIVAQRISTILYADQILVLDEGRLVGCGTHKELMKNCDVYSQIATSQLSEKELENSLREV